MIRHRNPQVVDVVVRTMEGELSFPPAGCMAELFDASARLDREGLARTPGRQEAT